VVVVMLLPFPAPTTGISEALNDLAILASGDQEAIAELGVTDPAGLPRPWDPTTCPDELRQELWEWLDQVATWINHEYAWRSTSLIPPCWPRHPHLVAELAVLACLRATAADATSPDQLEDWHRYALPHFQERMTARLGDSGCRNGHTDWPAAGRFDHFTGHQAAAQRQHTFDLDTHQGGQLRVVGRRS
jgi:hypothetical protein